MATETSVKVLFVCLGNICRSPTAEGVFRKLVREAGLEHAIHIDSAGTHAYHVGNPPDARAQQTASRRGIDLSTLRGRQASAEDLETFDYILAMDRDNLRHLQYLAGSTPARHVQLLLDYAGDWDLDEVPDPYYGGDTGFERVFDMLEAAAAGLLDHIRSRHSL